MHIAAGAICGSIATEYETWCFSAAAPDTEGAFATEPAQRFGGKPKLSDGPVGHPLPQSPFWAGPRICREPAWWNLQLYVSHRLHISWFPFFQYPFGTWVSHEKGSHQGLPGARLPRLLNAKKPQALFCFLLENCFPGNSCQRGTVWVVPSFGAAIDWASRYKDTIIYDRSQEMFNFEQGINEPIGGDWPVALPLV